MEDLTGLSRFIQLVEERFGRWCGSVLMVVIWLALFGVALQIVWITLATPIFSVVLNLSAGVQGALERNLISVFVTGVSLIVLALLAVALIYAVSQLRKRRVPQSAIDQLAELRSKGIRVLNDVPEDAEGVSRWRTRWENWRNETISFLNSQFTKAETLSFERLGIIEPRAYNFAVNAEHGHCLMMLSKQITILEDLIQRHQERR